MSYSSEKTKAVLVNRKAKQTDQTLTLSSHNSAARKNKKRNNNKRMLQKERNRAKRYPLLCCFWELPEYMKDNEYILRYYRANWPLKQALYSIFRCHNETLNVWTHLIGFFLFLGLTLANLMKPQLVDLLDLFSRSFPSSAEKNASHNFKNMFLGTTILFDLKNQLPMKMELQSLHLITARWPFFVFLCGSMFCLLSSSICHLFSCHSHSLNLFLLRLYYVGITVMIITSFFPQIYYVFLCQQHWQLLYLAGITAMGLFTVGTLLSPMLSTGKYRGFRAMLFCSMGLFGIVPAIHACIVNWGNPRRNVTLAYECIMGLSYLTGTIFYVTRVPERWKPGWFDIAGHSHQIFHVLVVVGALAHYAATLMMLDWRDTHGCDNQ